MAHTDNSLFIIDNFIEFCNPLAFEEAPLDLMALGLFYAFSFFVGSWSGIIRLLPSKGHSGRTTPATLNLLTFYPLSWVDEGLGGALLEEFLLQLIFVAWDLFTGPLRGVKHDELIGVALGNLLDLLLYKIILRLVRRGSWNPILLGGQYPLGKRYLLGFQELLEVSAGVLALPVFVLGVDIRSRDALLAESFLLDHVDLGGFGLEVLDLGCVSFVDGVQDVLRHNTGSSVGLLGEWAASAVVGAQRNDFSHGLSLRHLCSRSVLLRPPCSGRTHEPPRSSNTGGKALGSMVERFHLGSCVRVVLNRIKIERVLGHVII